MLAALTLQKSGNSTPRCSKLIEPSRQFVITTSRRSQVTSSYGWTPAVVHTRSMRQALAGPAVAARATPPGARRHDAVRAVTAGCRCARPSGRTFPRHQAGPLDVARPRPLCRLRSAAVVLSLRICASPRGADRGGRQPVACATDPLAAVGPVAAPPARPRARLAAAWRSRARSRRATRTTGTRWRTGDTRPRRVRAAGRGWPAQRRGSAPRPCPAPGWRPRPSAPATRWRRRRPAGPGRPCGPRT